VEASMRKLILVIFAATVLLMVATARPTAPRRMADLVGRWVGFETGYWVFYDLNLQDDGSGSLVVLNEDGSPDVYRLHWAITNAPRLRIEHDQRDTMQVLRLQTAEVIKGSDARLSMSSELDGDSFRIHLTVAGEFIKNGVTKHWEREALLIKKKDILDKIAESEKYEPK